MGDLHNFETPEKSQDNIAREAVPKKLYSNTTILNLLVSQLIGERKIEHSR